MDKEIVRDTRPLTLLPIEACEPVQPGTYLCVVATPQAAEATCTLGITAVQLVGNGEYWEYDMHSTNTDKVKWILPFQFVAYADYCAYAQQHLQRILRMAADRLLESKGSAK